MQDKITNVFISDGTDLKSNGTTFTTITDLGMVSDQMLNIKSGKTIANTPKLYAVNKMASGTFQRSTPVVGTNVVQYSGKKYSPARKCVWSIGYHNAILGTTGTNTEAVTAVSAGGSIEVNQSTQYSFDIHFTNDKTFYSERPEYLRVDFTSSASATQLSIAKQIANAINNSVWGGKEVIAIVVGDGTLGTFTAATATSPRIESSTGASNYGVEVWSLGIPQYRETSYTVEYVNFSVQVDSSTGFGATTVTQLLAMDPGEGTYEQVYAFEKWAKGSNGVLNWTKFPIPTQEYLSKSAGFKSGNFTLTATLIAGSDYAVFSDAAVIGELVAGSKVDINGTDYEIKYFITSTTARLTTVGADTGGNVKGYAWYSTVTIKVSDLTKLDGPGVLQVSDKYIVIFVPSIDASTTGDSAMDGPSTVGGSLKGLLDTWMTSTPLNPANITIAGVYA
jgi:hypothetical protein